MQISIGKRDKNRRDKIRDKRNNCDVCFLFQHKLQSRFYMAVRCQRSRYCARICRRRSKTESPI